MWYIIMKALSNSSDRYLQFFRITKYNPQFRNKQGAYKHEEWTSVYDIGKKFKGVEFTFDEYKHFEDAYIQAIFKIMDINMIENFIVEELEKYDFNPYPDFATNTEKYYKNLRNNQIILKDELPIFFRLILREIIWCKFSNKLMVVHIGYDYNMYIGSAKSITHKLKEIMRLGLYVEQMKSPYI